MTKAQTALIRESERKEVDATRWRKRMERWLSLKRSDLRLSFAVGKP